MRLVYIFVGGDTEIDHIIQDWSNAKDINITHVAMLLLNSTLESSGIKDEHDPYAGVWLHSPKKYIGNPDAKFIAIDVDSLEPFEEEARNLLGTLYGYGDCARGGIYDRYGIELPDNAKFMDCSETATRITRAEINILPDIEAGCVTPARLYRTLINDFGGIDITKEINKV